MTNRCSEADGEYATRRGANNAPSSCIESYTITQPLPPRELSKNGRPNPWDRADLYRATRESARLAWLQATAYQRPLWDGTCFVWVNWYYRGSAPDTDNAIARCSAIFDALQDAGIIINDRQIERHVVDQRRVHTYPHEDPRVEVKVWRKVHEG